MEPTPHVPTDHPTEPSIPAPRRRHRAGAAIAAIGLVASSACVGAAYAVHHRHPAPSASSSTSSTTNPGSAQAITGWGQYDDQQISPYAGQQYPGQQYSGQQYSGQQYSGQQYPSQQSSGASGAAAETSGDATASESAGLVEITSTLTNGVAAGTGLILSADGTIVTNHHVVAGATSIKVTVVATGKTYRARFVGADSTVDVAVLRLQGAAGLTPVSFASAAAASGDSVTAVGDAGGDGGTLTASPGTVSALAQSITVQDDDGGSSRLTGLIELHAYVVPGDSGGAVLDSGGDVVGMNVAASSGSQDVTGYAIPAATVRSIAGKILAGHASSQITLGYSGYLGIQLSAATDAATVAGAEQGGAAAGVGVAAGDTITRFNGVAVTGAAQLHELVARTSPGERATLTWRTSTGTTHSAVVTLGTGPVG